MNKLRLLLLDDHTLFRESLSRLLDAEPDFQMVTHCATVSQALAALKQSPVDLVLLDFDLGQETALEFVTQMKDPPIPKVLMVTAGMSDGESAQLLARGVSGIFLKQSSPALLTEAIRRVMGGEIWLDKNSVMALAQAASHSDTRPRTPGFTERERQVLRGVFEGLSNKEIGAQLSISESSVKAGLQQLFQKTGVRTRSQLVRIALEQYAGQWE